MIRILMTSTKPFEREKFEGLQKEYFNKIEFTYLESALNKETAPLAKGYDGICVFVTDTLDAACLQKLKENGVRLIALRSAGFNHVNLKTAKGLNFTVFRVPRYSPHSVAEFAVGLYLSLNRKIHRAHDRVRSANFSLTGLVGHDVHRQSVGIIGCGAIGRCAAQIFKGFGCRVVAFDLTEDREWSKKFGIDYVTLEELLNTSDVISLHIPLSPETRHMINSDSLGRMKPGSYLINTSRGGLVDTRALIASLKSKHLAGAALDVYEEEENLFFHDLSEEIIDDEQFAVLNSLPNVLITSHQAFLTDEALQEIAKVTVANILRFEAQEKIPAEVTLISNQ